MFRFRIGIRPKLIFLSLFLFTIPWLGYKYVWELESYLRIGQEQTMVGTARAVATALHERPALFDSQSSYLADVRPGTDLYAHKIVHPIRLDGELSDWYDYQHLTIQYSANNLIDSIQSYRAESLNFRHMVGQYGPYLYAMFEVTDEQVLFRPGNSLRIDKNDHLQISMTDENEQFQRYIVSPQKQGWVNAYLLKSEANTLSPAKLETRIQGQWKNTNKGYNLELRFPLAMMSSQIAFAITDVDDPNTRSREFTIGTANPSQVDSLGTVLVPSPDIEKILQGLKYSNARMWVVDNHMRVLARSGSIQLSSGLQSTQANNSQGGWWQYIEEKWLFPIYYQVLTKPPADFVDELKDAYALEGKDIRQALSGKPDSLWRLSSDDKAVILSAAHPIFIDQKVMGAVVVEQTTNGIRTLRNKALEQLFHIILAVIGLGTLALFLFASRISSRIRKLRNETEKAIDAHGKIVANIMPSSVQDEIGDLSRTFSTVLDKLSQYNAYLENMSSRLSHELRTPVAIIKSSLENLEWNNQDEDGRVYVDRAQQGIKRLSNILTNMSEATRLEHAMQLGERENFKMGEVVTGCVEGYKLAYPQRHFVLQDESSHSRISGFPELFSQMLDKIIANAVEFSKEDSNISIRLSNSEGKQKLSIENVGASLPENMQDQLLESMISVRSASNTNETHLGLGLYIAKTIVEYHQGHISIANSSSGTGVVVTITI